MTSVIATDGSSGKPFITPGIPVLHIESQFEPG